MTDFVSPMLAFGFEFSPWQLLLILVIVLLLFGGRVPEVMRNLGRGVSEFKKGMRSLEEDLNNPQPQQNSQPYQQPQQYQQGQYQPQLPQQPVYRAPNGTEAQDPRVAQGGYQQPPQQGYQQPYPQQPAPPQH